MALLVTLSLFLAFRATNRDTAAAEQAWREQRIAEYPGAVFAFEELQRNVPGSLPPGFRMVSSTDYVDGLNFDGTRSFAPSPEIPISSALPQLLTILGFLSAISAFLIGVASIGPEWSSRALSGVLLWEPRRTRLLASRGAAVCTAILLLFVTAASTVVVASILTAKVRGSMAGADQAFWLSELALTARWLVVCVLSGLVGLFLSAATRGSAVPIAGVALWLAVVETAVASSQPQLAPWTLRGSVTAWVQGGAEFLISPSEQLPSGLLKAAQYVQLGAAQAILTVLVMAIAIMCASLVRFRRLDVM